MQITAEPRDDYTILHLRGEFDTFYCPLLQKEIEGLIAAGATRVVLNLRLVKFINSTALGAIIKASKTLKAAGGGLAISRPSPFCRDILGKVGIDRIVKIYDSDEAAGAGLMTAAPAADASEGAAPAEDDESAVIFAPTDPSRVEHFIEASKRSAPTNPVHGHSFGKLWRGIGRMSGLDAEGVRFTWNGGNTGLSPFQMSQMLALGTDLGVKFRLPLLKRGHVEAVVTITEVEERPDGVKIGTSFSEIEDDARKAVQQYADDMAYLKKELRQATKE